MPRNLEQERHRATLAWAGMASDAFARGVHAWSLPLLLVSGLLTPYTLPKTTETPIKHPSPRS